MLAQEAAPGHKSLSYGTVTEVTQQDGKLLIKFDSNHWALWAPEEEVK